ncbi:hypothetical protein FOJ82_01940 [Tessaracoccus rhinocerotis]|uniref:Uncharacterized protein n=1 Tax=Tessaracoccus rhinocerotis TaxID=1689449 RepID=A0A553K4V6_9ACTN|nr:hypothetical protein [Tessaracoccus rhinocerotis]TRY19672.1 hypothetical protein FOJ82_01940 [Tessaracoccus rhinocerotis]
MDVIQTPAGFRVEDLPAPLEWLELALPDGWSRAPGPEEDVLVFGQGHLVMRVRVRPEPRFGIDVEIDNTSEEDLLVTDSPVLVLHSAAPQLAWLGGATGRVVLPTPSGVGLFRQWRGNCGPPPGGTAADGIAIFGDGGWVRAGQSLGSGWRLEVLDGLPQEPGWLPERCFVTEGDDVDILAPDAAVSTVGLRESSDGDSTTLTGPVGVHPVRLSDARGTTSFDVGWHLQPSEIAAEAVGAARSDDLAAWLHVAGSARRVEDRAALDELDMLLGESFEAPTLWGVLAGLRAAATTELPVGGEAAAAADALLAADPGSELAPILMAQGVRVTVGPEAARGRPAMDWWAVLTGDYETLRHRVLEWVDYGLTTSVPPVHGARGVALACLWLAVHEQSEGQLEVARATVRTFARLLAIHSVDPDPQEVAWLLLADTWLFEA